jgi:hypothetical protein
MTKVVVIGAGPAGIMASICLKEKLKDRIEVILLEKKNQIGKKLLASGNGKCNLSSAQVLQKHIYNNEFATHVFSQYSNQNLKQTLFNLGLFTKEDLHLRTYPITESAKTVVELFKMQLKRHHVKVYENTEVIKVEKTKKQTYQIYTTHKDRLTLMCDYIIFATGGKSTPKLGSNGEGYELLSTMHIDITPLRPGLVGLMVEKKAIQGLDGLRQKAKVSLYEGTKEVFSEDGEVQFKKDGLSGIVIMNASSIIARSQQKLTLKLDLLPLIEEKKLNELLDNLKTMNRQISMKELAFGFLPVPLAQKILTDLEKENKLTTRTLASRVKNYFVNIIGDYGFDASQVTIGGVNIEEITEKFELKKMINTYAIGELLDVDGLCGGYNIHFAIASGVMVANSIYEKEMGKNEKEK